MLLLAPAAPAACCCCCHAVGVLLAGRLDCLLLPPLVFVVYPASLQPHPHAHPASALPPSPHCPATTAGRLIAVGGMTGARMRLAVAEALDPREGRWQALPPMSMARSSCGAAALHDCVYVVGGNIGMEINENYAGVEAWVSAAGRWRQCSPISHGRSGLSVAPF